MKPRTRTLVILIGLTFSLAGCFDFEFPDLTGSYSRGYSGGYSGGYDQNFDFTHYSASFWIDSLVENSDSTAIIHAHIQYDSTMIITRQTITITPVTESGQFNFVIEKSDTVDFRLLTDSTTHYTGRKEWIYSYQIQISSDSLKRNLDYGLQILTEGLLFESFNEYTMNGLNFYWE